MLRPVLDSHRRQCLVRGRVPAALKLQGRVALVTGGSGGVGREVVREFAQEGAAVAIHYRSSQESARKALADVESVGGKGFLVRADLSSPEECATAVAAVTRAFGRLDILACFHGARFENRTWFAGFEDLRPEDFRIPLEVDLLGSVFITQAVVPVMREQRSGRIIFTASTPAITGHRNGIPYLVAKAGILGLTRGLASALGEHGIHVNALALGAVDTEAMRILPQEAALALAKEAALGRRGTPREVARKAVFLASDDAEFVTGQTLVVDGGYAMR